MVDYKSWILYEIDDEICVYMENYKHEITVTFDRKLKKIINCHEASNNIDNNSILWNQIEEWIINKYESGRS